MPGRVPVSLEAKLGLGGEAQTYTVLGSSWVAKVFHNDSERLLKQRKVTELIRLRESLCLLLQDSLMVPEKLLLDDRMRFVGYVMQRAPGVSLQNVFRSPDWQPGEKLRAALGLARLFAAIHRHGVAVGDPSQNNCFASKGRGGSVAVSIIDTDSLHLSNSCPCKLATPRYIRPEVYKQRADMFCKAADEHALAFLVFELLMGGMSPYQHIGGGTAEENAAKGFVPCLQDISLLPAGPFEEMFWLLPDRLTDFFRRAFLPAQPDNRSSADAWSGLFAALPEPATWQPSAKRPQPPAPPPIRKFRFFRFFRRAT